MITGKSALARSAQVGDKTQIFEPDLVLINGQIKTPSGWQEAVAISDGVIVSVGDTHTVSAMVSGESEVIDLKGSTVLPGMHDMHVHPLFAGMEQSSCGLEPGASPLSIAKALRTCVADKKPGEWIVGGNWVAAVFKPGEQTREFLDKVVPNNPVLLNDEAHHSVWVNSMALERAGITSATPDPEGGIIERNAAGEPNGLLRERAVGIVANILPPASEKEKREALILSTNIMLSHGITSFMVASVRDTNMGVLSALSEEGLIKQRVRGCLVWSHAPDDLNSISEALIRAREFYARPRFATDCIKIFLDGVPTESHTAAMLAPYADTQTMGKDERPERGLLFIPQPVLDAAVARFDGQGLHIKFHVAGDASVQSAINAVGVARKTNGLGGPVHHVGHSNFVSQADIPRVGELQMAWEFSPYIWYPTPITDHDVRRAVGEERMKRFTPIKEALDTGALVTVGSDWSVVPSVNPWLAIETMVTRQKPGGSSSTVGVQERVSLDDAIKIMTENGARLMGHRDKVGAIEVGMRADIIVTETNPYEVPVEQVHTTRVKMTFIDGEKVFDSALTSKAGAN
ncbi:MAG: amidohydrolase [Halieaceae bacterium]|nr:amidohydrolase [Halieaceae bacterium]